MEGDSIDFKDFIHSNQLMELQISNGMITWTDKRRGPQHIASKLDRFLMSDNAIHLGGDFHASIMPQVGSDHWPIMLQWSITMVVIDHFTSNIFGFHILTSKMLLSMDGNPSLP